MEYEFAKVFCGRVQYYFVLHSIYKSVLFSEMNYSCPEKKIIVLMHHRIVDMWYLTT